MADETNGLRRRTVLLACWVMAVTIGFVDGRRVDAQAIRPELTGQLSLKDIGSGMFGARSDVTQMVLTDGPNASQKYLFMASNEHGIRRATYNVNTRSLVAGSLIDIADDIAGLGIAFYGDTMYASDFYTSSRDDSVQLSRLWRIEDMGTGTRTEIVQGIPRDDHGVNNIQIVGNSLYVGIGNRTRNGAFQTWSGDHYGESAYGGSISVIDDLREVGPNDNAAGFFPANPIASEYRALIDGSDPIASSPFTTTDPGKLRVHSSGTRNPFGTAVDGDGELWFTNNFSRVDNGIYDRDNLANAEEDGWSGNGFQDDIYDQIFKAAPKADYGYRNGNWQGGNDAGNTDAVDAGFFNDDNRMASFVFDNYVDPVADGETDGQNSAYNKDYEINDPVGLGPSGSSNGLAFYQANELPLKFHQDAFIARWNGTIQDGGDSLTFRDVVSLDKDTGKVTRIASGFRNPLDVIEDGNGGFIVADHGGSIYVISAVDAQTDAHPFSWDSNQDGSWSDRLTWNANSLDANDRLIPHEWGTARYAVSIVRPDADVTVSLDRDARVESVQLTETLRLANGSTLTVDQNVEILRNGSLAGGGTVDGLVKNNGQVAPGNAAISVGSYQQGATGRLVIDLVGSPNGYLDVETDAKLDGTLNVTADLSGLAEGQSLDFDVLTAASISGDFDLLSVNLLTPGENGHLQEGRFASTQVGSTTASVRIYRAGAGDADGDGLFNSVDLIRVLAAGEFEDGIPGNSDWTEGDWDGNLDFGTSDIVSAFQGGTFVAAALPVVVPEPSGMVLAILGLLALIRARTLK